MLIPVLYREAKARGVPMTVLVNQILSTEVEKFKEQQEADKLTKERHLELHRQIQRI